MGKERDRIGRQSYEDAPPTRFVPITRADPVPPPPTAAPTPSAPPVGAPRSDAPRAADARTPFAVERDSMSGMVRLNRHRADGRVAAVAVIAAAALLALALAFAALSG